MTTNLQTDPRSPVLDVLRDSLDGLMEDAGDLSDFLDRLVHLPAIDGELLANAVILSQKLRQDLTERVGSLLRLIQRKGENTIPHAEGIERQRSAKAQARDERREQRGAQQ